MVWKVNIFYFYFDMKISHYIRTREELNVYFWPALYGLCCYKYNGQKVIEKVYKRNGLKE